MYQIVNLFFFNERIFPGKAKMCLYMCLGDKVAGGGLKKRLQPFLRALGQSAHTFPPINFHFKILDRIY